MQPSATTRAQNSERFFPKCARLVRCRGSAPEDDRLAAETADRSHRNHQTFTSSQAEPRRYLITKATLRATPTYAPHAAGRFWASS
jgi:hypothetical protein